MSLSVPIIYCFQGDLMKIDAFTPWENCWVRYMSKYFANTEHDLVWHIGQQVNMGRIPDVGLFCWADDAAIKLSKHPLKICKRYVVFIRSYEIFYGLITQIKWKNIDDAIFVNKAFYEEYKDKLPCRVHYLPNCIDLDEWKYQDHTKSFKVGMVCSLNHKKGINMVPQLMWELNKADPRYEIYIAGKIEEPRYEIYLNNLLRQMGLEDKVHFEGQVKDIQHWWEDKDYLFTCSVTEGHPNNGIEAMALGVKPVIHYWMGAEHNFPEHLMWKGLSEAVKIITEDEYDSKSYRCYAQDNFDMRLVYPALENILSGKKTFMKESLA